ncbi:MAG: response regulator [Euryarchaeota archaeon]|nr:response regulator [Euryarchaeota archaeon]
MTKESPTSRRVRVLIVDDDEAMRFMCRTVLEDAAGIGMVDISEATGGEEAVAMLRRGPFDLILCDQRMSGMSGIEVLALCRTRYPDMIRIMMTGFGDPSLQHEAREKAAVHGFIEKPMDFDLLERALIEVVVDPYLAGVVEE